MLFRNFFKFSSSVVINRRHLVVGVCVCPEMGMAIQSQKVQSLGWNCGKGTAEVGVLCCMKVRPTVTRHYLILN